MSDTYREELDGLCNQYPVIAEKVIRQFGGFLMLDDAEETTVCGMIIEIRAEKETQYSRLQNWIALETYALNANYLNGGNTKAWDIMYNHIVQLCDTFNIPSRDYFIFTE